MHYVKLSFAYYLLIKGKWGTPLKLMLVNGYALKILKKKKLIPAMQISIFLVHTATGTEKPVYIKDIQKRIVKELVHITEKDRPFKEEHGDSVRS